MKKVNEEYREAYIRGFEDGKTTGSTANPYSLSSLCNEYWMDGYNDATQGFDPCFINYDDIESGEGYE